MLRRLFSPRSLVAHVLVLAAVATMVSLGFWQLRRLDQARAHNDLLERRMADDPVEGAALRGADPERLEFRRVVLRGQYLPDREIVHLARGYRGRSGNHVLTPLRTADGLTVLVDRGWVPSQLDTPPVAEAPPPSGEVEIVGQLFASQEYASFGPRDATQGRLERVLRVNLPRIEQDLPEELRPLAPLWVQVREQTPAGGELPLAAELPELDDGPHLGYAVQWFLFALTALVAYGLFVRHRLTGGSAEREQAPVGPMHPPA